MTAAQMQKISIAVPLSLLSILILSGAANAQPALTATGSGQGEQTTETAPTTSAQQETNNETFKEPTARVFELVLPGEHLFGDWGGLRSKLEESGITPRLILVTDLAGNPSGGRAQGTTAPSSVELSLFFDLEKIAGLKGGSVFASFSHRWGHSLSAKHIGNTFSAQQIFGFQTYRVIDVSYQQKLFDDRVELRLGRFAAMDDFLVSPYNFGMMQNAFCGNPFGILLNAPGMSAYYGAWAALGKVKPTKRSYVMTGVYNGDPKMRDNKYHGVNLSMNGPLWAFRPGARPVWQSRQQPRIRRFRLGHCGAGFPHPATALVRYGGRFGARAVRRAPEGCRFVRRRIRSLQRRPETRAAKWPNAWSLRRRPGLRDDHRDDLSLRPRQGRFFHPARLPIHPSARRHKPF